MHNFRLSDFSAETSHQRGPPSLHLDFGGCGRLLRALNPTLQCFLVSTVFGTVSSLHLTSFLMIFTLVYLAVPGELHVCASSWL